MLAGEDDLARQFLADAGDQGHAAAFAYLGAIEPDAGLSAQYFQAAADGGFAPARNALAQSQQQVGTVGPVASSFNAAALCDQLAAHPRDSYKPRNVRGVEDANIDIERASLACIDAVAAKPSDVRLNFQLGRVLYAGGMLDDARNYLWVSAGAGHQLARYYEERLEKGEVLVAAPEPAPVQETIAQGQSTSGSPTDQEILAAYGPGKTIKGFGAEATFRTTKVWGAECFPVSDTDFSCEYKMFATGTTLGLQFRQRFDVYATLRHKGGRKFEIIEEEVFRT